MGEPPDNAASLAPTNSALQHKPRPLPLFLDLLRSETAASPERMAAALKGLDAYQTAPRTPRPPDAPIIAEAGRACLRDYGGEGPKAVFVPSLINPPYVLDLAQGNSLLRWLSANGVHPYLVDWGVPGEGDGDYSVAGHIERCLLPLFEELGEPAHLAGYCLGGTMAAGAAAVSPPLSLTMIAAPWRFSGFPDNARADLRALFDQVRPACETLGYLPMEVLQTAFWKLDPARTVSKFEKFGRLDPESGGARAFVALEDWANEGPPLTLAAARELIEDFFGEDVTGKGQWTVAGKRVDPAALPCPVLDIISTTDRIVPEASAARAGNVRMLAAGHVGMMVGGRAEEILWRPLAEWLSQAQHNWYGSPHSPIR